MDRIIGKSDKYLNTAVILPIVKLAGEPQIIFERRSSEIPQGNEVCFPGGHVDKTRDGTPAQAAIRETCEELGLSQDRVAIKCYWGTVVAPLGVAVDAFIGEVAITSLEEITPNASEVQSVFSIPVSWFQAHAPQKYQVVLEVHPFEKVDKDRLRYLLPVAELGLPERYKLPWGGRKLPVYVYATDHGIIWGITAEILRDFIENWR